jgi:hypothetical protein
MSHLNVVSDAASSPGRAAIQLMEQARSAGEQQVTALLQTLEIAIRQANEVVDGGDVYPAGVRDVAAKLAEHNAHKAQSIVSIMRPSAPTFAPYAAVLLPALENTAPPRERTAADEAYEADFPTPAESDNSHDLKSGHAHGSMRAEPEVWDLP